MPVSVTFKSHLKEVEKKLSDDLYNKMQRAGIIVKNQAKDNVNKTGNEHPQVQTGQLINSIFSRVTKEGNEIITEVGTSVLHGKWLELSYRTHYPWLFPAVELKRDEIKKLLGEKAGSTGAEVVGDTWVDLGFNK